jgi:uncharacterized protein (TIGR03066 family)
MNAMRVLVAGVMVCVLAVGVRADDTKVEKKPDNAALLLGTWEATKVAPFSIKKGTTVEFANDGKLKFIVKDGEQEMTVEGTYKVEGAKFSITMKVGDMEQKKTITIKKISEKELSTEDEMGKAVEFTKKK